MNRYIPSSWMSHGETYLKSDPDGDYVQWDEVEDILLDILDARTLDEAKNYVSPHISVQDGGTAK